MARGGKVVAGLTLSLLLMTVSSTTASDETRAFEGSFSGTFRVRDLPDSDGSTDLFIVKESGNGTATIGAFRYQVSAIYDANQAPSGCGPGSSTAVDGTATITLKDGRLDLELSEGTSCFAFPTVVVNEVWSIVGGTRTFAGADGALSRSFTGDVRFGTVSGTWTGTIELD